MGYLLGISGSLRAASTNRSMIGNAARHYGGEFIEADIDLPLYNGDVEAEGIPASVQKLAEQIANADAVVISTPEYNESISGVLKNALDWVSRTKGAPWKDKPVAVMSVAAGRTGGVMAQAELRRAMLPFGANVLNGPRIFVAENYNQFAEDGTLSNEHYDDLLSQLMANLKDATGAQEATKAAA